MTKLIFMGTPDFSATVLAHYFAERPMPATVFKGMIRAGDLALHATDRSRSRSQVA